MHCACLDTNHDPEKAETPKSILKQFLQQFSCGVVSCNFQISDSSTSDTRKTGERVLNLIPMGAITAVKPLTFQDLPVQHASSSGLVMSGLHFDSPSAVLGRELIVLTMGTFQSTSHALQQTSTTSLFCVPCLGASALQPHTHKTGLALQS